MPSPTNVSELLSYLFYLLLNPTFNLNAALILYAAIVLLLLFVLVLGILGLMPRGPVPVPGEPSVEEEGELASLASGETFGGRDDHGEQQPSKENVTRVRREMSPRARLMAGVVVVALLVCAWVVTGYATSRPALCTSCHWPAAQHAAAAKDTDPHVKVACVSCHESGGFLGRYVTGVPGRLLHFLDDEFTGVEYEYGAVTHASCSACHRSALVGVVDSKDRGLKMSHKEPLAASATCIDCHKLRAGVVATHNAGMTPCLRCHDSVAQSAECGVCHDTRVASAARSRTTSYQDVQIPDVSCGGCHDEKQQCDPCHGMRMPHTTEFKMYAHSRAGAVDFWYNNGKTCARCHTASRRPCQQCHSSLLGAAHGKGANSLASGHKVALGTSCDTCHGEYGYNATRDFCADICHTPAAVADSPR